MDTYAGSILHIDLTTQKHWTETLPEDDAIRFGGGRGVNARLLWNHCPRGADPLGPDNPLIFGVGALTGTTAPCTGRTVVTCRSPATQLYAKSSGGGAWGASLKFAGYDHLVIHGRSSSPVWVLIDDSTVTIRDAADLWGLAVPETNTAIASAVDLPRVEVAAIGPAGEHLVKYASVMFGVGNAAARCGVGAVMGSKGLKAIAVHGSGSVRVNDVRGCDALGLEFADIANRDDAAIQLHRYGTVGDIPGIASADQLATFNYREGDIEGVERISGQGLDEAGMLIGHRACFACVIGCHLRSRISSGVHAGTETHGPEYETACSLGSLVGVTDSAVLVKAAALCNELGMDTISVGGVLAWAMECAERGVLSASDFDGLDPSWGNGETVVALIERISRRQGIGDVLADGVRGAAAAVGKGSDAWAVEARGLEQSRIDVRWAKAYALSFAVNPRGPDHLHAQPNAEVGDFPAWVGLITHITGDAKYHPAGQTAKRPEIVVWHEDYIAAMDNLGFCMFTYSFFYPEHFARYLSAATGLSFSSDDVQLMGRRTLNLERAFNYREGYRREMDTLPRRMLDEVRGPYKLTRDELEGMLQGYYALHGWDPVSGAPTVETLERLGLGEFASFADTPSTTATR